MAVKKKAAAEEKSGDDKTLAQAEKIAMDVYRPMGVPQFKAWVMAYFHPYQVCGPEKKKADMGSSTVNLALIGLVQAVVGIIIFALVMIFLSPFLGVVKSVSLTVIDAVIMLVAYPIGTVVFGLLGSLLYYIIAKLLGGKGSFWEQTYCMALVSGGILLMMVPFNILQIFPLVGWIFSLVGLVIALYGVISQYRMIRAVHELSQLRAIVVLVVPAALAVALIIFFIGVAAIASLGAYGAGIPMQ